MCDKEKTEIISNPAKYGKEFTQFCQFRDQVIRGMKPLMYGDNYIVMSRQCFDDIYAKFMASK